MAEARGQLAAGRADRALHALESLAAGPEEAPAVAYLQASVAMGLKRWSDALPVLSGLVTVDSSKLVVHLDRARCLIELGRLGEARDALSPNPPIEDCLARSVMLAWVAAQQGHNDEVVEFLGQATVALSTEKRLTNAMSIASVSIAAMLAQNGSHDPAASNGSAGNFNPD